MKAIDKLENCELRKICCPYNDKMQTLLVPVEPGNKNVFLVTPAGKSHAEKLCRNCNLYQPKDNVVFGGSSEL